MMSQCPSLRMSPVLLPPLCSSPSSSNSAVPRTAPSNPPVTYMAGNHFGHSQVPAGAHVLAASPSNPPKDFSYMAGRNFGHAQVPAFLSAFRPYTTQIANYPSHILNTGTNAPSFASTSLGLTLNHHGTQSTPAYFQHDIPGGSTLSPGVPQHNTQPGADSDVDTTLRLGMGP